jgi:HD-GYP domain-containing protein (c-di-GMP phosphodiesterase class II)
MYYPFKFRLGILLFTLVLLMSGFLGIFQYLYVKHLLEEQFEETRILVKDRIVNIVSDADHMNMLLESPLEKEAQIILEAVLDRYRSEGSIDFDLKTYVEGKRGVSLYIINRDYTIIAATHTADLGLNFKPWPEFTRYLDEVFVSNTFSAPRISLSLNGSNMTKFCYLPSGDGKYIFETGTVLDNSELDKKGSTFDNFEETVIRDNKFVDLVTLYDYEGVSYKKDANGMNAKIDPRHIQAFSEAMLSMKTVELEGQYQGREVIYQFVPYQIVNAQGSNQKNVIEVIYNKDSLNKSLRSNLAIVAALVSTCAVLAGTYGFFRSRSITRPIDEITAGIDQVSAGDFDVKLQIRSKDEFAVLGKQFERMAQDIRELLEERYRSERELEEKNEEILQQKEEITTLFEELESMLQENLNSYFETVRVLANAIEAKDSYTGGHCERVMEYSTAIAQAMGLSGQELNDLRFGSILHDIGKIGIPEEILNNNGSFSDKDYETMRRHPEIGSNLIKDLQFLENSRKIVLEHHERVDGKGYPKGLTGDKIGLLSKIVCVADAYDAMTSTRPYRKESLSKEIAVQELLRHRGTQFDEQVVDAFVDLLMKEEDLSSRS